MKDPSISEQFKKIVQTLTGRVAIIATAVDPDAVSSSLALKLIIEQLNDGLDGITIFYGGEIGHPQSRAMFQRYTLGDTMKPADTFNQADFQHIALVDSSMVSDARCKGMDNVSPTIVIDHHNETTVVKSEENFVWIEPVSATATLITELMQDLKIQPSVMLRSLLCLGIYTDTKKLAKNDERGFKALAWLTSKEGTSDAFGQLVEYTLPRSYFSQVELALNNAKHQNGWLVSNIGFIKGQDGDNIATIADDLARQEAVTFVLVFAIVDDAYVRICVRSNDVSVPIGTILKRFGESGGFKTTSNGKGEGGARMYIEKFNPWFMPETKSETLTLITKAIETMVFI